MENLDIQRKIVESVKIYHQIHCLRIVPIDFRDQINGTLQFVRRCTVSDTYIDLGLDRRTSANVLDQGVAYRFVRNRYQITVQKAANAGAAQTNGFHHTIPAFHHDTVTQLERLIQKDHDPAEHIIQQILKRQAERQTTDRTHSQNRRDIDPQVGCYHQQTDKNDNTFHYPVQKRYHLTFEHGIDLFLLTPYSKIDIYQLDNGIRHRNRDRHH